MTFNAWPPAIVLAVGALLATAGVRSSRPRICITARWPDDGGGKPQTR